MAKIKLEDIVAEERKARGIVVEEAVTASKSEKNILLSLDLLRNNMYNRVYSENQLIKLETLLSKLNVN